MVSMNIESEIRAFITKEQFNNLLEFFKNNATLTKEDYQETFYFDCEEDLRIQRNKFGSKIWLKKGKIHDDSREEIEVKFNRDDFDQLENLFKTLGHDIQVKWFRERHQFDWNTIKICLDYTKGYGYIIELEKLCSENDKESTVKLLREKLKELKIEETPKEEFDKKFKYYLENWETLTK